MANTDNAFGLKPWGPVLRATMYAVQTAPTIAIYTQDVVKHGANSVSTPLYGYRPIIEDGAAVAAGEVI